MFTLKRVIAWLTSSLLFCEISKRFYSEIIKALVCVIRLSLRPRLRLRQITQTSALIILAIMLNLIQ